MLEPAAAIVRAQVLLAELVVERVCAGGPVDGLDRGDALLGEAIAIVERTQVNTRVCARLPVLRNAPPSTRCLPLRIPSCPRF